MPHFHNSRPYIVQLTQSKRSARNRCWGPIPWMSTKVLQLNLASQAQGKRTARTVAQYYLGTLDGFLAQGTAAALIEM